MERIIWRNDILKTEAGDDYAHINIVEDDHTPTPLNEPMKYSTTYSRAFLTMGINSSQETKADEDTPKEEKSTMSTITEDVAKGKTTYNKILEAIQETNDRETVR